MRTWTPPGPGRGGVWCLVVIVCTTVGQGYPFSPNSVSVPVFGLPPAASLWNHGCCHSSRSLFGGRERLVKPFLSLSSLDIAEETRTTEASIRSTTRDQSNEEEEDATSGETEWTDNDQNGNPRPSALSGETVPVFHVEPETQQQQRRRGGNTSPGRNTSLVDIASSITQEQCRLLGSKSIGVDYGLVRTGIAVTVGYDPTPLDIVVGLNTSQLCHCIVQYARREQAARIIVGWPLHKNGTVAEQTNLTWTMATELAYLSLAELGPAVSVELFDERYTSKEAAARAHAQDPDRYLYGSLDAEAACIILEQYYHDNGQGRQRIPLVDDDRRTASLQHYQTNQEWEQERRWNATREREERMLRRKQAIARMQQMEALERQEQQDSTLPDKKKKKKRKKRK